MTAGGGVKTAYNTDEEQAMSTKKKESDPPYEDAPRAGDHATGPGRAATTEITRGDRTTDETEVTIRRARLEDAPVLSGLIGASLRALAADDYTPGQIESALRFGICGVDTRLIADGTYYVAEAGGGRVVACGGWSRRRTGYGADNCAEWCDGATLRDPAKDPAVIRAFFVHPDWTRRGIGRRLLEISERAAAAEGYATAELFATHTGERLYRALGYADAEPVATELPDGQPFTGMRMTKTLREETPTMLEGAVTETREIDSRPPSEAYASERDAFAGKMLAALGGAFETFSVYLGDRLGIYRTLADGAALTPGQVAARTGTSERYVREWLEHQTVIGILEVADPDAAPDARRFYLSAARAEVLADTESLNYLAPLARLLVGAVSPMGQIVDAYRTGGGVPYADYGVDMREGQSDINRTMFLQQLGQEWLPAIPDVHARLKDPASPARVADIGCGGGWSSIGMARAYPNALVEGFDLDEASIELARANVREAGVADRALFYLRDAADPELAGRYDLVTAFECLHDMSDPVGALRAMGRLAGENGTVLVVDERVNEKFEPRPADDNDVDWMMYGWSVFHCLPVGMAENPAAGTGTVMRPDTLREYARRAGFSDVEVLPIDNYFWRFYRLHR